MELEIGETARSGQEVLFEIGAAAVRDGNHMRDSNGLTYARKSIIRSGLSLNLNCQWRKDQLFPHLKNLISKFSRVF